MLQLVCTATLFHNIMNTYFPHKKKTVTNITAINSQHRTTAVGKREETKVGRERVGEFTN